jgi:hypothetical protein
LINEVIRAVSFVFIALFLTFATKDSVTLEPAICMITKTIIPITSDDINEPSGSNSKERRTNRIPVTTFTAKTTTRL